MRKPSRRICPLFFLLVLLLLSCGPTAEIAPTAPPDTRARPPSTTPLPPRPTSAPTPRLTPSSRPTLALTVEPTRAPAPTATPRPTAGPTMVPSATPLSPVTGPFVLVPAESGRPAGFPQWIQAAPDGTFWLGTSEGIASLQDGVWTVHWRAGGYLVGSDAAGRVWVVLDEGAAIAAWDGAAWTRYGAEAGWTVPERWLVGTGDGPVVDRRGWVWLTTGSDVRAFDGTRWTIHTSADIGFVSDEPDYMVLYDVAVDSTGDVWVGECEWWGPGPWGDGARWFDGQSWQGANSPVVGTGAGCMSDIEVDVAGRIWVGKRGVLWRYTPGAGWTALEPPAPQSEWGRSWGAMYDLILGPAGDLWLALEPCGGASCLGESVRYHLVEDEWFLIGGPYRSSDLALAPDGSAWLCAYGDIYHVVDNVPMLVAEGLAYGEPCAIEVDAAGRVWVAGLGTDLLYVSSP